ncbi:MAG: aminotransferase class III-fold pyridoxal phosphate-dependent enzyme [Actinobacteria bacterium]|nr:aminotransferase class III-fold pyridoxal phosphate-dependent enzyme [Actinomycetota bacterium]
MVKVVPGGVNSNVRLEVAQRYFARGAGARLWDTDGQEYIDYVLGQGPAFLGHAHPRMLAGVTESIAAGMTFAAQTEIELEAAESLVKALVWADMVRIGMTSTESVQAALRLARAATGRRLFLRFRGQYHGWLDNVLINSQEPWPRVASDGQLASSLDESITIEWNDLEAVHQALAEHPGQIAAIITEPMMLNAGAILPEPGFLEGLREITTAHGIILIFDETITGFRLGPSGAIGRFGVEPDLAIFGKAVAGGFPASVLAGNADLMSRFAKGTNHSGTFNANVLACAAIVHALAIMQSTPIYDTVERTGGQLMASLRGLFADFDLQLQVRGLPAAFHVAFDTADPVRSFADLQRADSERYRRLVPHAIDSGVWLTGRGIWYVSGAHDEATNDATLARMTNALKKFVEHERIE